MYFAALPKTRYAQEGEDRMVPNLLCSVGRRAEIAADKFLFEKVAVRDGESPESVAHTYYGHVKWWWVVCLSTGMTKPTDWPESSDRMIDRLERAFGDRVYEDSVFEDSGRPRSRSVRVEFEADGEILTHGEDSGGLGASRHGRILSRGQWLSRADVADRANERKRYVSLVHKDHLDSFVAEFRALMRTSS